MKKIIFLLVSVLFSVNMMADEPTQLDTNADDVLYITGTLQTGVKSNLYLMMKNTVVIGTTCAQFTLPAGVTISDEDVTAISASVTSFAKQADGSYKLAYNHSFAASSDPVVVATIPVTCTATPGSYNVVAAEYQMVKSDLSDIDVKNVYTTINVQRAAAISDMASANNIEIIPFSIKANTTENEVSLLMTNVNAIGTVAFDMYLPTGISWSLDGVDYMEADLDNYNSEPNQDISENADGSIHVGFTRSASKYYFNAGLNAATIATIYLDAASTLADGVYTIKLKNIELDEKTEGGSYTGEYYTSVFVGTPTETDPIVYGHYTTEGQTALKAAATNFASVDMSAAIVSENPALDNVLVYGPTTTSYSRDVTAGNYGTICLPFELTSGNGIQYYTLSAATDSKLTFTEATTVPANTPALFKSESATYAASADGYQFAQAAGTQAAVNGLTFTGTYDRIDPLASGNYFIQQNQFYMSEGAAKVKPFRGYFAGSLGVKALSIAIEDETGIHDVTDQISNDDIYNLQGMKLNKTQKGVNIIGGKKYLVK